MLRVLEVSVPCFWCPEPPWEKSRLLRCGERPCRGDCGHPAAWLTKASWTTSSVNSGMTPVLATIWLRLHHSPAGQPTEPWEKVANCCFKPLYWHRTILKQTGFLLICLVLPPPYYLLNLTQWGCTVGPPHQWAPHMQIQKQQIEILEKSYVPADVYCVVRPMMVVSVLNMYRSICPDSQYNTV